jgi:hypothetical protein
MVPFPAINPCCQVSAGCELMNPLAGTLKFFVIGGSFASIDMENIIPTKTRNIFFMLISCSGLRLILFEHVFSGRRIARLLSQAKDFCFHNILHT